ncbi:MAG: serine/threonine-protein kinase [Rhizonema sp. NSF051]|nr:serine/threonine-protein kinase [Rhizonema sp. NSF051]
MVWVAGHKLQSDKYIIEELLGQGGFGITYKARHTLLNQLMVIKTPNEALRHDPEYPKYVQRFIEEGRRLEKLSENQHPNIVRIRDLFHENGTYYLVMDFVQGESLYQVVHQRGKLPQVEAIKYARQIGDALMVVHRAGLVHRDVHPGNIMVQQDGKAVLIDFGIAGETVPTTISSKFFANPSFAPYEEMRGNREPTVDVYSLAASLYYAVTGKLPTSSFNRKVYKDALISPQEIVSTISNDLNQAILKGMEVEAQDRPRSIQEWLVLLGSGQVTTIWSSTDRLQGGKYTIIRIIAQGGFGITYLARDDKGDLVVIKTLNERLQRQSDFSKFQEDFVREALRLAKCRHPYIVQVEDVFQEGQLWCMVMEYIQGEHLADRVMNRGVLPEAEALLYIHQIGEALTVVHNNGLLHRDVKPANIILRGGKTEAVLIDFGIAREFTPDSTQPHTTYLSHCFAPIEQYKTVAKRGAYTDVYALAATLYFVLTNQQPPAAPQRATGNELQPPKQINPSISDRVNQAILVGMELEAKDRPQSMQHWLEFLGNSTENPDVLSHPPMTVEELSKVQQPVAGNQLLPAPKQPTKTTFWLYLAGVLLSYSVSGYILKTSVSVGGIGAVVMTGLVAVVVAEAVAGASRFTLIVAIAGIVAVAVAVAFAVAVAGSGVFNWAAIGTSTLALTLASQNLLQLCSRFQTFVILLGTSSLGFWLGGSVERIFPIFINR